MKLLRTATVLLVPVFLSILSTGTAFADPQDNTDIGAPTIAIGLASITGGIRVCGIGTARVAGPWSFHVAGARASTNAFQIPISYDLANPGSLTFNECYDVMKLGAATGEFAITFEYLGGGIGGTKTDRPAAVHGVAFWAPGQQDTWVVTTGG